MNKNSELLSLNILRVGILVAAVADFAIAVMVVIPDLVGQDSYTLTMGMLSVVALSWGVLLISALKRPLERRWVLKPTMLVVLLLGGICLEALLTDIAPAYLMLPGIAFSLALFILLLTGFIRSKKLASTYLNNR